MMNRHHAFLISAITVFFALGLQGCEISTQKTTSPTPFLLSSEARAKYDVLLANEIETWNTTSTTCNRDFYADSDCKEKVLRNLADQGYEVAGIVLKLYTLKQEGKKEGLSAYEELRQMALKGNSSALCFTPLIFWKIGAESDWPYTSEGESFFTKEGVSRGLPLCSINEFYSYYNGLNGYPKDQDAAHIKLLHAAGAGYFFAQERLFSLHRSKGFFNISEVRKSLCWGALAHKHSRASGVELYIEELKSFAWSIDEKRTGLVRNIYLDLARDWDPRTSSNLSSNLSAYQCVNIEKEI